jgi:tetratricopeptide (TPR) repeat protein
MARTLLGLGKFKESQILLNKLLDKDPYCKEYWNALATSQLMSEEYHDAITSSEYALAIDPKDTEALANKANGLANLSNFEEALKYYQRYIEIEPDNAYILFQSGACLVNLGRNEEALDVLLKALSLTPEGAEQLPILYQELAFCYNALKQFDKAMEMLDKTKDLDCDHVDVMVTRGHLQLGNGNVKAAQKSFIQAIADSESDPYVILRIAISLYDNAYIQACYDMFMKLFTVIWKNHPEFTEGYSFMALCCYELNKPDEFLKYLKLACEKDPLEVKNTLAFLFPEEMEVKEYYRYMKELINSKSVN